MWGTSCFFSLIDAEWQWSSLTPEEEEVECFLTWICMTLDTSWMSGGGSLGLADIGVGEWWWSPGVSSSALHHLVKSFSYWLEVEAQLIPGPLLHHPDGELDHRLLPLGKEMKIDHSVPRNKIDGKSVRTLLETKHVHSPRVSWVYWRKREGQVSLKGRSSSPEEETCSIVISIYCESIFKPA